MKANDMISVLCPTRGRPEIFNRMVESAFDGQSDDQVEILAYIDADDDEAMAYKELPAIGRVKIFMGEVRTVGQAWNKLARRAQGSLLMMGNDDLIFWTKGWARLIFAELAAKAPADGLFMAWTDDGSGKSAGRCAFPIVTRRWYETVGYFAPECFHFLYHDTWIHDIAKRVDRAIYLPNILIEHAHFSFKKAKYDETYRRHRVGQKNQEKRRADKLIFEQRAELRQRAADELTALMQDS